METNVQHMDSETVKIVLERHVRAGAHARFEEWLKSFLATAARSSGLQGSSVLRSAGKDDYFILLRFSSRAELERWERSPEVKDLLEQSGPLAVAPDQVQVRTGLETWFTLPGAAPPASPPPKWKMALVTWLALLPQVIVLAQVIPSTVPFLAGVALSTAIPVAMLTWIVMPRLSRWLHAWLYAPPAPG
jgi:antibiotic biosynthesis monooxygenase (ABM) superfamily enzyme